MITAEHFGELVSYWQSLKDTDFKPSTIQAPIDDLMYTSTKIPAVAGIALWPNIVGLLGAGMTRMISTGEEAPGAADAWAAVVTVADRAARLDFVGLLKSLLANVQCGKLKGPAGFAEGKVLTHFDTHFSGEYLHLLKVCALALAHNFRGPTYGAR